MWSSIPLPALTLALTPGALLRREWARVRQLLGRAWLRWCWREGSGRISFFRQYLPQKTLLPQVGGALVTSYRRVSTSGAVFTHPHRSLSWSLGGVLVALVAPVVANSLRLRGPLIFLIFFPF